VTFTIVDEVLIEFGQLRLVAYGALVIVLFLWIPRGVIPTISDLFQRRYRIGRTPAERGASPGPEAPGSEDRG
jgi:hypothetical protein